MKDVRVTFSRRHAYATKSNVLKVVKTPGGRLVGAYRSKKRQGPKCGDCHCSLPGIKRGPGSGNQRGQVWSSGHDVSFTR